MATVSTRVVAGLDPAIHAEPQERKSWMPGSSPGMTTRGLVTLPVTNLLASCP
ncbi:hypothetical protein ACVIU7_001867 [Bradyrhizobium liaoningense]